MEPVGLSRDVQNRRYGSAGCRKNPLILGRGYSFSAQRRNRMLILVTEAKGVAAADTLAALKKGEMAAHATALLTGTGWLPAMLRAA